MINKEIFKSGEAAIFKLRSLYKQYGYLPFKMSKFEEYDFYVRSKDFLQGGGVITFNDTNGDLLALKPDVTLSIIKNTVPECGCVRKVYYDENVYRISGDTHRFKEIMQTGIECIGDIDAYSIFEVLSLAAKSLSLISDSFVVDISQMGILKALLAEATDNTELQSELTALIAQKNTHELSALCNASGISEASKNKLTALTGMHGGIKEVTEKLRPICKGGAPETEFLKLEKLVDMLSRCDFGNKLRLDFSVVNNMSYYDGIVFRGFIEGIPDGVLSGGQYGALLAGLGKSADAVGFAIYLDALEALGGVACAFDVDVLLLYSDEASPEKVMEKALGLIKDGKTVSAQKAIPEKLRYRELIRLD